MVRPALFEAETPTTWAPEKDDAPEKAAAGEARRRAPVAIATIDFMVTCSRFLVCSQLDNICATSVCKGLKGMMMWINAFFGLTHSPANEGLKK